MIDRIKRTVAAMAGRTSIPLEAETFGIRYINLKEHSEGLELEARLAVLLGHLLVATNVVRYETAAPGTFETIFDICGKPVTLMISYDMARMAKDFVLCFHNQKKPA